jgi:hypothetical protein
MAKAKSRENKWGDPVTIYINSEQKKKVERLAEKRSQEIKAPVSVSAFIRHMIDEWPEEK